MSEKPFIQQIGNFAQAIALHTDDHTYTYGQLHAEILARTIWLREQNIESGKVIFLQGDFSFRAIATLFALYQNGNIIALNTASNSQEIDSKLFACAADFYIDLEAGQLRRVEADAAPTAEVIERLRQQAHAGLILFSSGTTGKPKAMVHDFENIVNGHLGKRPRSVSLFLFLLFDHIGGINTLLNVLGVGGVATITRDRTPDSIARLIERHKIAILPTSPTFLNLLLLNNCFATYDVSSLRMITYGTEPMPESLLTKLQESLPRVKLLQTFGTSETGIIGTTSLSSGSLYMKFDEATGEHKIVDGELWLRSKQQILGYLNHQSDSFTEDGWFRTGDAVEVNEKGYLRILGRRKEIINVGGEKVYPAEVESVLLKHPNVVDCKAYGETNTITGQFVAAEVVLDKDYGVGTSGILRSVRAYAKECMDNYKVPVRLKPVKEIKFSSRFKKVLLS